jgi:hypothetical protein
MTELNNASDVVDVRELRDDELDDVAGGGALDSLFGALGNDVNGLVGNPGGVPGAVFGDAQGAITTVTTISDLQPNVGSLLSGFL